VNSIHNLYGISLTLKALNGSQLGVEYLLGNDEELNLFWSQKGTLVKIGLIDTLGAHCIHPGEKELLKITGNFELTRSLAASITPDGKVVTLKPQVINDTSSIREITFDQNWPNPFNPETKLSFALPQETHVSLEIFNLLGQKVVTLADEIYPAGRHEIIWDGTDSEGKLVSAGVYFSKFRAGDYIAKGKLLLLK